MLKKIRKSKSFKDVVAVIQKKEAYDKEMNDLQAKRRFLEDQIPKFDAKIEKAAELKQDAIDGFFAGTNDQSSVEEAGQELANEEMKKRQTNELLKEVDRRIQNISRQFEHIRSEYDHRKHKVYYDIFQEIADEILESVGENIDLACAALQFSGSRAWYDITLTDFFRKKATQEQKDRALGVIDKTLSELING